MLGHVRAHSQEERLCENKPNVRPDCPAVTASVSPNTLTFLSKVSHYVGLNEISKPAKRKKNHKISFVSNKKIKRQIEKAFSNSS